LWLLSLFCLSDSYFGRCEQNYSLSFAISFLTAAALCMM
jgi:hypothetical protein